MINGKGRVLKPFSEHSVTLEVSLTVHGSLVGSMFGLLKSLLDRRGSPGDLITFVHSCLEGEEIPFDLTCLASHREVPIISSAMRVSRIKKMLEVPGLVHVTKQNVYFQPRATFGSRKVKRFPLTSFGQPNLVSVKELKYKLIDTSVELEFGNGKILFLQFASSKDRETFTKALTLNNCISSMNSSLPPLQRVTELWRTWKVSNFDYLMYLNAIAGRSINDIGQYPILPWTVSDMSSVTLDLTNPSNFRSLGEPIASVNEAKLAQAKERALQMPVNERFLFGSFYSNPAFVLYFLLRRYPECHLRLHGGHFDHTARLFTSLKGAWEAVAESGSATMELIPEFYSDFDNAAGWLMNPPGMTDIPGVKLPEWATSPKDFVVKMRCALESLVISEKLNEWIDLVFGAKSRGKQICFDHNNLFHPVCYLTDVTGDLAQYCRENDLRKEVVLLQSQEFGHVPLQLFTSELHPKRDLTRLRPEWSLESFYLNGGGREHWRTVITQAEA